MRRACAGVRPLTSPCPFDALPSATSSFAPPPTSSCRQPRKVSSYTVRKSPSHESNCSERALSMSSPSRRGRSRFAPRSRIARSSRRAMALKSFAGYSLLPHPKTAKLVPARRVFSTRKSRDISVSSSKKGSVPGTALPPVYVATMKTARAYSTSLSGSAMERSVATAAMPCRRAWATSRSANRREWPFCEA